ncbi:MAG: succinate dehydrogenase cytochrome b subunit [Bacteroidetes bacterium]|nr:succinate dehydrogenase cytochrome b subunit [Bacteroidota bacterium]MDA0888498.1 succinate dehydrogenase cytochrome b subunit [Bacteroidota bacterium]MDA1084141.1 succinate dehydrogenase cytochrome b subunit [Bacteroidota bacterium]
MGVILSSTILRKVAMALSGIFLMVFLLQHFVINITSVFSATIFNQFSHFMGTNPVVQFLLQPVLIFGVIFHFVMGFVLDIQNRRARGTRYAVYKGSANASWASRNMIISGATVLAFLALHFYDFWVPEINYKYVEVLPEDPNRYYEELVHKFEDLTRVVLYVVSFFFLALHLSHGFSSAFQSMGFNNKYTPAVKSFGKLYAVGIPLGFAFIAIFHFLNH